MYYLENISLKKLITLIKTEIKTNSGGSADRVTYDNTTSGLAGSNVQEAIDELASNIGESFDVTIGTTWTGDAAPYTQEIVVAGIIADDNPVVDLIMSDDYDTSQLQLEEWAKIYRIVTANGLITVYATEPTTVELFIQLLIARDSVLDVVDSVNGDSITNGSITAEKVSEESRTQYFSTTLSTEWIGETAPYSQTVSIDGILESDRPKVYFEAPDTFENLATQQSAFAMIYDVETADGTVTFKAKELPEVAFNVTLEVSRI